MNSTTNYIPLIGSLPNTNVTKNTFASICSYLTEGSAVPLSALDPSYIGVVAYLPRILNNSSCQRLLEQINPLAVIDGIQVKDSLVYLYRYANLLQFRLQTQEPVQLVQDEKTKEFMYLYVRYYPFGVIPDITFVGDLGQVLLTLPQIMSVCICDVPFNENFTNNVPGMYTPEIAAQYCNAKLYLGSEHARSNEAYDNEEFRKGYFMVLSNTPGYYGIGAKVKSTLPAATSNVFGGDTAMESTESDNVFEFAGEVFGNAAPPTTTTEPLISFGSTQSPVVTFGSTQSPVVTFGSIQPEPETGTGWSALIAGGPNETDV